MTYQPVIQSEELDQLFDAILSLADRRECYQFFEDVCTIHEMQDMAQRLQVARMLDEAAKYQQIVAQTGASTATISRVNRCLTYGAGGYRLVLQRAKEQNRENHE